MQACGRKLVKLITQISIEDRLLLICLWHYVVSIHYGKCSKILNTSCLSKRPTNRADSYQTASSQTASSEAV